MVYRGGEIKYSLFYFKPKRGVLPHKPQFISIAYLTIHTLREIYVSLTSGRHTKMALLSQA